MRSQLSLSRLLRYYFQPYPWFVLLIFASSIGFVVFETLTTAIVYPLIGSLLNSSHNDNIVVGLIKAALAAFPGKERAIWLLAAFGASYILMTLLNFLRTALSDIFAQVITRDFQTKLFDKYLGSDYQYFLDNQQGTILFRTLTAPTYMAVLFSALPKLVVALLKLVVVAAVLLLFSFQLTLVMIALGVVFYAAIRLVSNRVVYRNANQSQVVYEAQNVIGNEAVTGIREIKIRNAQDSWVERFRSHAYHLCHLNIKRDVFRSLPSSALQVGFIASLVIIMFSQREVASSRMVEYVPLVGLYFYAFMRLAPSLTEIATLKMLVAERQPYAEAVYRELETPSRRIRSGSIRVEAFARAIAFDHVSFAYPGREHTLRDVTVSFEKGQTTALVGHSGCGKSTMTDLIVRLFDVDTGRILVDGCDVRELDLESWRRRIGYVNQDTFIINATVRENIAFLSGSFTQSEIEEAAKAADAHDFIKELPQQYDTMLGDRGLKLSGGQRQRIAIARALIRKPDILIFDEATSALDSLSELEVQTSISRIARDHTVILIAHRLSTIRSADKIIVLEKGQVVEEGRHEDLIARRGPYYQLYASQHEALLGALADLN